MLGFPIEATRLNLPRDLADRIKAVVLTPRIYRLGNHQATGKGCRFRPGVAFRFHAKGATPVVTYLCFSCDDLGILRRGDVRLVDVSAGRLDLLSVAADTFPDADLRRIRAAERNMFDRPAGR